MRLPPILACVLLCVATSALAQPLESVLRESRTFAEHKDYDQALLVLSKAEKRYPHNPDIILAFANVLSWQQRYDEAEKKLAMLTDKQQADADALLLKANLAFYKQDYPKAEGLYQAVLAKAPDYLDAQTGLEHVHRAQTEPRGAVAAGDAVAPTPTAWQLDIGFGHSSFSRVPQKSWDQEFAQLTRFFNNRDTALHANISRYEEFDSVDVAYEVGLDQRFTDYLNGYIADAFTPDAHFKADNRVATGGAVRFVGPRDGFMPSWFTLDTSYDAYTNANIYTLIPGVRVEPLDGWALSTRRNIVFEPGHKPLYGYDLKVDGTLLDSLRFFAGFADAPETEAAITVRTMSFFGGFAWDATDDLTLRLAYTHDDRDNSYIRHVVDASLSYRF